MSFWIPTKPYSFEIALHRMRVATGSVRQAMISESTNWNGHHLTLSWNNYRGYYVGEYFWGGRQVITRGLTKFETALEQMIRAYDQGGLGTCLSVTPRIDWIVVETADGKSSTKIENKFEEDWEFATKHPRLQAYSKEIADLYNTTWRTWKHELVNEVLFWEKQMGVPVQLLIEANSKKEWISKREEFLAARRLR